MSVTAVEVQGAAPARGARSHESEGPEWPKGTAGEDLDIATCATRENSCSEGEDEAAGSQRAPTREPLEDYPFYDDEDEDEDEAAFAARAPALPSSPRGPRPSLGSRLHASGGCRPCAWYWKPGGCLNGAGCGHCHECPEGEIAERRRLRKPMSERPPRRSQARVAPAAAPWGAPRGFAPFTMAAVMSLPAPVHLAAPPMDRVRSLPMPGHLAAGELAPMMMGPARSLPAPPGLPELAAAGAPAPFRPPPGLELEPMTVDRTASAPVGPAAPAAIERTASAPAAPVVCLPSVGSSLHASGMCKPCAWYWKPGGCQNAQECRHCHLCPLGEIASRKRHTPWRRGGAPRGIPRGGPSP